VLQHECGCVAVWRGVVQLARAQTDLCACCSVSVRVVVSVRAVECDSV